MVMNFGIYGCGIFLIEYKHMHMLYFTNVYTLVMHTRS